MSREKRALDRTDIQLLAALQEEGRRSNVSLADLVGLTPPPCMRRVRDLKRNGYIRGYYAVLDAAKLNQTFIGIVLVSLKSQAQPAIRAFVRAVDNCKSVREAYSLQSDPDFLLKCVTSDEPSLHTLVASQIMTMPHVKSVRISTVRSIAVCHRGVPLTSELIMDTETASI